jgi:hypothetical protein
MKAELRAFLLANAGLASATGRRVDWYLLPQGAARPAIALHEVSAPRDYTMRGRVGLTPFLVQMDIWADTRDSAETVRAALIAALDGTPSGNIKALFIENERSDFDPADGPGPTGSTKFYRSSFDVRVWTIEA